MQVSLLVSLSAALPATSCFLSTLLDDRSLDRSYNAGACLIGLLSFL